MGVKNVSTVRLDKRYYAGIAILIERQKKAGITNPSRSAIIKQALSLLFEASGISEEEMEDKLQEIHGEKPKKRRFSLKGMIENAQVDDKALDEVKKIWESRPLP